MGLLKDGQWVDQWYEPDDDGAFVRQESQFRQGVGDDAHPLEADRYHLYVSYACPWAHRTLILRALKGLTGAVSLSVVHPLMLDHGWTFDDSDDKVQPDPGGARYLYEVYQRADPAVTTRVTVPVLWDKKNNHIVNNESADIIRLFSDAFSVLSDDEDKARIDFYPLAHRAAVDGWNDRIYPDVNNGVYKCGFATTQKAYSEAFAALFSTLDDVDAHLADHRYLAGPVLTEADWRLFTTLIRFDAVYLTHFKCNRQRLEAYPHLSGYLRELYQWPGVAETVHFDHIKGHYFRSHKMINPHQIVPDGPALDLTSAPGRDHLDRTGDGLVRRGGS